MATIRVCPAPTATERLAVTISPEPFDPLDRPPSGASPGSSPVGLIVSTAPSTIPAADRLEAGNAGLLQDRCNLAYLERLRVAGGHRMLTGWRHPRTGPDGGGAA
jgi:hypothetical protein